jgi:uncharacterized surface protein with fasciclin (FAS1) repeats
MKRTMRLSAALVAGALFVGGSFGVTSAEATSKKKAKKTKTTKAPKKAADTAVAAGSFKTLAAALGAAGLVDTLKGAGPFTVFAPTDDAFAALPAGLVDALLKPENKAALTSILTYHVVAGKVLAKDVVGLKSAKTVNTAEVTVTVTGAKVKINDANVVTTDIAASNGVIHVIDKVLVPPGLDVAALLKK